LLKFRTPIEKLDRNVRRVRGPFPRYPPNMQMNAIEAKVMLQFVVDADGRTDMSTLQVLAPVPPLDFVKSVLASVSNTHFDPLVVRGCAVRSLVQQPFVFGINGR
jgi:TonB family protein